MEHHYHNAADLSAAHPPVDEEDTEISRWSVFDQTSNKEDEPLLKRENGNRLRKPRGVFSSPPPGEEGTVDVYPFSSQNIGIIGSYFSVGLMMELSSVPIQYYLIEDLSASSADFTYYSILVRLPWSLKVVFGLISDVFPVLGLRRLPYFFAGWGLHILSNVMLAMAGEPGLQMILGLSFVSAFGYVFSDVMTDAMLVEKSRHEPANTRKGNLQATAYVARFLGSAIGTLAGTLLYNKDTWGWGLSISAIFWLNALLPLLIIVPTAPFLVEAKVFGTQLWAKHAHDISMLVQNRAVWQPMSFVFIYNMMQIPNAAWTNFVVVGLGFSNFQLGMVSVGGAVFTWVGSCVYKQYYLQSNWQRVYLTTTIVVTIFSFLQVILITGLNRKMGIPDIVFAIGDDVGQDFVAGLQILPLVMMYTTMCPSGSEGTSFAMLTTFQNVASSVSTLIGDNLTKVWDTSNDSLSAGNYSGVLNLTLLTSACQCVPLLLLPLLPAGKAEQEAMQRSSNRSRVMGALFLFISVASVFLIGIEAILEVFV